MSTVFSQGRKSGIGGSECAAVLGLSQWKTPLQVYLDKVETDIVEDVEEESQVMRWGNILEPVIIKQYEELFNVKCDKPEEALINPKYPWMFAHIDSWVVDKPIILEAKTTRFFDKNWGEQFTDNIPVQYLIQCAHYCIICDHYKKIDHADIAALGSLGDFRIYHYFRNKELEEMIIEKTHKFWHENVLKQIPPEINASDDISKLYRIAKNDSIAIANTEISGKYYRLLKLKKCLEKIDSERSKLENELKNFMQENDVLVDVDGTEFATWKNQETKRIDSKYLKHSHPNIYSSALKTSTSRVFRVK